MLLYFFVQDKQVASRTQQHQLPNRVNPLIDSLDVTLKKFKVRRHAHKSQSFVGNHVNKCLKVNFKYTFKRFWNFNPQN